ncbi:hypothetical protein TrRE_jg10432 [Triparma retinervis]|uniref:Uncharacterized protein n=1 Tax=Triparma retinervis TaxID=2557542 RepID=A0A9W7A069_9STRA|nr:hypothetical protein TrRE_jg10432 [Triparma retinervis]
MSRLFLHTPLSRAARLRTSKARYDYASKSDKYRTKKDADKDSWPWQIQYLGYLGGVLTVPAAFLSAVVEQPKFRTLIAGDSHGRGGFSLGRTIVDNWRDYYTKDEDGVVRGFHNEDYESDKHLRSEQEARDNGGVEVRVKGALGRVGVARFACEDKVGKKEVILRAGFKEGEMVSGVELVDEVGEGNASEGGITGDATLGGSGVGIGGGSEMLRLTGRTSTWHVPGNQGVVTVDTEADANPQQGGAQQASPGNGRRSRKEALKEELKVLEGQLNDPFNTVDIDDLQERIKQKKKEIGWGFW